MYIIADITILDLENDYNFIKFKWKTTAGSCDFNVENCNKSIVYRYTYSIRSKKINSSLKLSFKTAYCILKYIFIVMQLSKLFLKSLRNQKQTNHTSLLKHYLFSISNLAKCSVILVELFYYHTYHCKTNSTVMHHYFHYTQNLKKKHVLNTYSIILEWSSEWIFYFIELYFIFNFNS